jgi:predicted glycosyltransferase
MTRGRVFFHVQHLLGSGHLRRAMVLAEALQAAGLAVDLVSGGRPEPGLGGAGARLIQLPPLRAADANFSGLVDENGAAIDDSWKARRRDALLGRFHEFQPDVLLIEGFPFARRQLRFELLPLLEAARARKRPPLVIASVRDIVQARRKPGRVEESAALAREYFDAVLIHGDPGLVRFEESFPLAAEIADLLHYTGYVVPSPEEDAIQGGGDPLVASEGGGDPPVASKGSGEVIVSAGGGAVGRDLFAAALGARALSSLGGAPWRLLAGANMAERDRADLAAAAPPGVTVEPARSDFRALLATCALSISQVGYNTTMDILWAGVRSVMVPFSGLSDGGGGGGETEQPLRAARLSARGLATVLPEADLTPERLARAVDEAAAAARPRPHGLDLGGAGASAVLVTKWLAERSGGAA